VPFRRTRIAAALVVATLVATLATIAAPAGLAAADPAPVPDPAASTAAPTTAPPAATTTRTAPRRHAIYLEALGKGGVWGLGYALALRPRLAVGLVASFTALDGQHMTALAPSLTVYPLRTVRHRWFVDAGPQLVHLVTPSPVPEWSGTSSTGVGGQLSTGYEYRRGVLVRTFAMLVVGRGGVAPWLGVDLGWTL